MKNRGFNPKKEREAQDGTEWVFGAASPYCLASIPENYRADYFPLGEVQKGKEDFMSCASISPINLLETKFNYLVSHNLLSVDNHNWLVDNGYFTDSGIKFSDRFVAINSGTTRNGNSMKAPLDAIRKQGLIPKSMLPPNDRMTFAEYHNAKDISPDMTRLGQEFLKRFSINYEKVYEPQYGDLLSEDMLAVAGYAWPKPKEGIYPKVNYQPNHAFMIFKNAFYAFDSYEDIVDGDFIKHLARDYNFMDYGYRLYISENVKQVSWVQNLVQKLLSFFF